MGTKYTLPGKKDDIMLSCFDRTDADAFVRVHLEHLFSDSDFSRVYLRHRFEYLLEDENVITVSAKDEKGTMLGIVYGGPEGYKSKMNRHIMSRMIWNLLRRPSWFFGDEFAYKYRSYLDRITRQLRRRSPGPDCLPEPQNTLPLPILRLTGIAVMDEYSNLGIGRKLITRFEQNAKVRGYKSIVLETPNTNVSAIRFYERIGWCRVSMENANMGKVYLYKLISDE